MNFGYFWVFWRIFFGYTGIPLPPLADPDLLRQRNSDRIMMSFNKFIIHEVIFADYWVKIAKEKVILQKTLMTSKSLSMKYSTHS